MSDQKNEAMNAVLSQSTLSVTPELTVSEQERDVLYQRYLLQKMYLLKSLRYKNEKDNGDGIVRFFFILYMYKKDWYPSLSRGIWTEIPEMTIPDMAKPFLYKNDRPDFDRFEEGSIIIDSLFEFGDLSLTLLKEKIESIESDLIRIMTVLDLKSISDPVLGRQVGLLPQDRPYFTKKEMAPYVIPILKQLPAFQDIVKEEVGKKDFSDIVVSSLRPGSENQYNYEIEYIDIDTSSLRAKAIDIDIPTELTNYIDDFGSFLTVIQMSERYMLRDGIPVVYLPKTYQPKDGEELPIWKEWKEVGISDRIYKG